MTHTKNKDKNHKKNIDVYIVYLFGFFQRREVDQNTLGIILY